MSKKSSLYPDILFHFTTRDGLFNILNETFKVSYAREKIVGGKKTAQFAVPMVSFCDLKLSELKGHMEKYGHYGIGLTKSWANEQGLNPVFYVNRHSPFVNELISAIQGLFKQLYIAGDGDHPDIVDKSYMSILNTFRYTKNYEGVLARKDKPKIKNYRFADDREWRYVPAFSEEIEYPFLPLKMIKTDEQKALFNEKISHLRLKFLPEDIKYLIIERDDEISGLIRRLEDVKGRFDKDTRDRLSSRILTAEQINNDI